MRFYHYPIPSSKIAFIIKYFPFHYLVIIYKNLCLLRVWNSKLNNLRAFILVHYNPLLNGLNLSKIIGVNPLASMINGLNLL